jgi:hypothetical protein
MPIELKHGETQIGVTADLSTYFTSVGKVVGDVTDSIFMIKLDPSVTDIEANYQTTGLSFNGDIATAYVSDFTNLVANTEYSIAFGIKFTGDTTYREVPLTNFTSKLLITQDLIRG